MLSKTAEYALRAAVCMAADAQRPESAEQLAKHTKVPRRYLHRVLQDLVRAGLVDSNPGPGGGYRLTREPSAITILDVVAAVAPIQRIEQCPLGLPSHVLLCPLHAELDAVLAHVEQSLKKISLAQVLRSTHLPRPLCDRPTCAALGGRARSALGHDG